MLYFGSFNPIHKGHIALAEYAIEKGLCDEVVLVVSPQNPLKPAGHPHAGHGKEQFKMLLVVVF